MSTVNVDNDMKGNKVTETNKKLVFSTLVKFYLEVGLQRMEGSGRITLLRLPWVEDRHNGIFGRRYLFQTVLETVF